MRRGALISFAIHAAIVIAAIVTLPPLKLKSAADEGISVELVGPSEPQQANAPNKVPAPSDMPVEHQAPKTEQKPKPQPIEAPPPPPPPPPPAPEQPQKQPTPPAPAPPPQPVEPTPQPPPSKPPPPPTETPAQTPTPPPPPAPPQPPAKTTPTPPPPKLPMPPAPQPPAPAQSATHQKQVVKTPSPLSKSVLNTLMNLRSSQQQQKPPKAQYNPDQGGAPNGGGSTKSTANSQLSGADKDAIGNHVRPCWTVDAGAPGLAGFSVNLMVTTDPTGTVRDAVVAPSDQGKLGDPIFAAYAQRAIQAVMNYQCATLPLPSYMLGKNQTFLFNFKP